MALTGHRPNKLGNEYNLVGPYTDYINREIDRILIDYRPDECISGMALGADTLWAIACLYAGIPLIAAIPFEGQELNWLDKSQKIYKNILSHPLVTKKYICAPGYNPEKMQKRNEWMVDNCDILIAVWDGSSGGTGNCVRYAKSKDCKIIKIDPRIIKNKKP